jgi:hypothetical protein
MFARAALEPTPVDMVCSNVEMIDGRGAKGPEWTLPPVSPLDLDEALKEGTISALGCACAYSRSLWTAYGPISEEVLQEDVVLPFRALLGRGIRVIDEPLVQYRVHETNLFAGHFLGRTRAESRRWARSWAAVTRDWQAAWTLSGRDTAEFARRMRAKLTLRNLDAECYDRSRSEALFLAIRGLAQGLTPRNFAGLLRRHVLRVAKGPSGRLKRQPIFRGRTLPPPASRKSARRRLRR